MENLITEIQKLELKPGDILIVKADLSRIDASHAEDALDRINKVFSQALPKDVNAVFMDDTITLMVARQVD